MKNNSYDDKGFKPFNFVFKYGLIAWLITCLISLTVAGGLFYVALHFVSKFW